MTTRDKPSGAKRARAATPRTPPARTARAPRAMPDDAFAELLERVREGARILRGEQVPSRRLAVAAEAEPDVAAIRERMRLSQSRFALLLGISPRTLHGWSRGAGRQRGRSARCCGSPSGTPRRSWSSRAGSAAPLRDR